MRFPSSARHRAAAVASTLLLVLAGAVLAGDDSRSAADAVHAGGPVATYRYVMKGKVRLLFFWVGKDDVGGGTIQLASEASPHGPDGPDGIVRRERIEVLFGSNPERVPGGHNRWGYAYETASWREPENGDPYPEESVFEGFMRRSNEESLSEVTAKGDAEEGLFWYTGTRSEVTASGATAEIRYFSSPENFDYRNADPIREGYRERLQNGAPDKVRKLDNRESYEGSYGFLSATRRLLNAVVGGFNAGEKRWRQARPSVVYVHNARLFRLRVQDVDYAESFRMDRGEAPLTAGDVAHVSFRIERLDTDYKHDFVLSIPLRGQLRGIPLRIVDKPRWWLRIELDLAPDEAMRSALERRPPSQRFGEPGQSP